MSTITRLKKKPAQLIGGLTQGQRNSIYSNSLQKRARLANIAKTEVKQERVKKYGFTHPDEKQLDKLVLKYFSSNDELVSENISPDNVSMLYNKKITGSHISELRRTAELFAIHKAQSGKKPKEVRINNAIFKEAVETIDRHFKD